MRTYRGNGFTIQIPEDWTDHTIFTIAGAPDGDFVHRIWIIPDMKPRVPTAQEYARKRIKALLDTGQGWFLAEQKEIDLAPGLRAVRADLRWCPSDEQRLYQRQIYVAYQKAVYALSAQMTKRTRATRGETIDKVMATFRPAGLPAPPGPPPPPGTLYTADLFTLAPGEGWVDETTYMISEPDESRFRRNLVMERRPMPDPPASIQEVARADAEELAASVHGFELDDLGSIEVRDGHPASRLDYRRRTEEGGRYLRQTEILAWRAGFLHIMTLTFEEAPPDAAVKALAAVAASFSAAPAVPAPAGAGRA